MTCERTPEIEAMLSAYAAQYHQNFIAITTGATARGWLRLFEILGNAKDDPVVALSPGAQEFAELIQRRVGDSIEHVNAEQTFNAVRSDMSKADGRRGAQEREANNFDAVLIAFLSLGAERATVSRIKGTFAIAEPPVKLEDDAIRKHLKLVRASTKPV